MYSIIASKVIAHLLDPEVDWLLWSYTQLPVLSLLAMQLWVQEEEGQFCWSGQMFHSDSGLTGMGSNEINPILFFSFVYYTETINDSEKLYTGI